MSAPSRRALQERHGGVEVVHGDLRRHGVGRCGLQGDRRSHPASPLHGVRVVQYIRLRRRMRGHHAHHGDRSVARERLRCLGLVLRRI